MKKILYSVMLAAALTATSVMAQTPQPNDKKSAVWVRDKGKSRKTTDSNGNTTTHTIVRTGEGGNAAGDASNATAAGNNAASSNGDTSGTMTSGKHARRHHLKS